MERIQSEIEMEIVKLFLEKLEKLTQEERRILIKSIEWISYPLFVTNDNLLK